MTHSTKKERDHETPKDITAEINSILNIPEVQQESKNLGADAAKLEMSPEERKKQGNCNKIEEMRRRDQEKVTGVFRYVELPGGSVDLHYRKHKGEKITKYCMIDGETYTVPRGLADQINDNCKYFEASNVMDAQGNYILHSKAKKIQRMMFTPSQF